MQAACRLLPVKKEIRLLNPSHLLRLRTLKGDNKALMILKNRDAAQRALIKLPQEYMLRCINQDCEPVRDGDVAEIAIESGEVLVFEATKQ